MKIAISANGADLNAATSPVFGRCAYYILLDTETMAYEALPNSASGAAHGAGIGAAQSMLNHGVEAVISGNVGPNAFHVLQAANVAVYLSPEGTVAEAVEAFKAGKLQGVEAPTAGGPGGRMGRGGGGGRGRERF
mgnify:CR=1 FL=1